MLAAERQSRILNLLRQRRSARVGDLAQELEVSEVTIRRDLDALARENLISKVHGGATLPLPPRTEEPGFEAKRHLHQIEKERSEERRVGKERKNGRAGRQAKGMGESREG